MSHNEEMKLYNFSACKFCGYESNRSDLRKHMVDEHKNMAKLK